MKKNKKKKKLKIGRLFLLIIIFIGIYYLFTNVLDIRISSIKISGNNNLSDQEIIEIAKIDNYPSFFNTFTFKIKKNLKNNPYIKECKVTKGILSINIKIEEKEILYINKETKEKVTLNSSFLDDKKLNVPILSNSIPNDKIKEFNKAVSKINQNILSMISEIKYDPNEIDEDRYYVYMNDGNGVYLTVNKFKKINDYNKILESVGKKSGILYLDYGDYFKEY